MPRLEEIDISVLRTLCIHKMAMTLPGLQVSLSNRLGKNYAGRDLYRSLDMLETSQMLSACWVHSKSVVRWALTGKGLNYLEEWLAQQQQQGQQGRE